MVKVLKELNSNVQIEVSKKEYSLIVTILNFINNKPYEDLKYSKATIKSLEDNTKEKNRFTAKTSEELFSHL
ncbi:MAG: hypothetical protein LBQ59_04565 [Candidatus Peribacteria bacterium]|jgi:hypothetical protein|nr:hypothetical protein [Candidatus Peribacteria bacterium]